MGSRISHSNIVSRKANPSYNNCRKHHLWRPIRRKTGGLGISHEGCSPKDLCGNGDIKSNDHLALYFPHVLYPQQPTSKREESLPDRGSFLEAQRVAGKGRQASGIKGLGGQKLELRRNPRASSSRGDLIEEIPAIKKESPAAMEPIELPRTSPLMESMEPSYQAVIDHMKRIRVQKITQREIIQAICKKLNKSNQKTWW